MKKTISLSALAKLLMLSERRIQQLAKEGYIKQPAKRGEYDIVDAVQGYIKALKTANSTGPKDIQREKLRLVSAQAEIAELKVSEAKGELVETSQVIGAWGEAVQMMKTKMLSIPSKAAQFVRVSKNDSEAKRIMEKYIKTALADLANVEIKATTKD